MKPLNDHLSNELKKRNLKHSIQRLSLLKYLVQNQCHPTVDQIFTDMQKDIPTLSKTTVYNILNLFIQAQLVRVLTIEDNETRYDIVMENHGHFKCESCGTIYNFAVDIDRFVSNELRYFKISDKNVFFKGICPQCISAENK